LDLGPAAAGPAGVLERGWWQLPEPARVEVIALLARLIARGVLAEGLSAAVVTGPADVPVTVVVTGAVAPGAGEGSE
jgi:hypothetical protein